MERILNRAFNQVHSSVDAVMEAPEAAKQRQQQTVEEKLRQETAPMTAADAVERITLAWKDNDYFRLLQLPHPEADELGRPIWDVSSSDISRSYRRLSVLVHPDKNPGNEAARTAFEHLNAAYRALRDPGKLEEKLKEAAVRARQERERREARASVLERVAINARANEARREARQQQGKSLQDDIARQMQEKAEEAKRKRQLTSRYRRQEEEGEHQGEGSDPEEWQRKDKGKKRKKPTFI